MRTSSRRSGATVPAAAARARPGRGRAGGGGGRRGVAPAAARQRATCDGGAARERDRLVRDPACRAPAGVRRDGQQARRSRGPRRAPAALIDAVRRALERLLREACEATHVSGEQSAEVLDLRMACLDERLASVRALADTFASADARTVDRAVTPPARSRRWNRAAMSRRCADRETTG